jgi:predicted PurR-regulated permease PerM
LLAKIVRGLAWTWIGLAGIVILLSYAVTLFTRGLAALRELVSPFNVANFIAVVITIVPGIVLLKLAEALKQRRRTAVLAALIALPVSIAVVAGLFFLVISRGGESRGGAFAQKSRSLQIMTRARWDDLTEQQRDLYTAAVLETWGYGLHADGGLASELSDFVACVHKEKLEQFRTALWVNGELMILVNHGDGVLRA